MHCNHGKEVQETQILYACNREKLYENGKVFNLDTFGPMLHVKLDDYLYKDFRLMRIFDVETSETLGKYYYDEISHPWIDIPVEKLNLNIGLHSYSIEFINLLTGDTFYQYFNYTIQSDNPPISYIYMDRGDLPEYVTYHVYDGDYTVTPSDKPQILPTANKVMKQDLVVFAVPITEEENESGVTITVGGEGHTNPDFISQTKTIIPSTISQTITADAGYDGLSQVVVEPIPASYRNSPITLGMLFYDHASYHYRKNMVGTLYIDDVPAVPKKVNRKFNKFGDLIDIPIFEFEIFPKSSVVYQTDETNCGWYCNCYSSVEDLEYDYQIEDGCRFYSPGNLHLGLDDSGQIESITSADEKEGTVAFLAVPQYILIDYRLNVN